MGQRVFLAAFGRSMSGFLRRQQSHYGRHLFEIRLDERPSIPIMSPYSANTAPFGGFGLTHL